MIVSDIRNEFHFLKGYGISAESMISNVKFYICHDGCYDIIEYVDKKKNCPYSKIKVLLRNYKRQNL